MTTHRRPNTALALAAALLCGALWPSPATAITGGQTVSWSSYWFSLYQNFNRGIVSVGGVGQCTGLLVAPRLVLTAGHCGRNGNFNVSKPAGGPIGFDTDAPYADTINAGVELDHYDVYGGGSPPDKIDVGLWVLDRPASYALPYWVVGSVAQWDAVSFFGAGDDAGLLKAADCIVTEVYGNGNTTRYSLACGGQQSEGGDSGGPVFDAQLGLVGVNRGGEDDPRDGYGTVLTPDVVAWIEQRIAEYATILHVGDFDGDGRGDLFHWNPNDRESFQDQADGWYTDPTYWHDGVAEFALTWCAQKLLVGRFDAGVQDDLLCYDAPGDVLYVNYAGIGGFFPPLGAVGRTHTWCDGEVSVGDFNGDLYDDLFCRQTGSGRKVILNSQDPNDPFPNASTWLESSGWCTWGTILMGRFDGNGDDALCWYPGLGFDYRRGQPDGALGSSTAWASDWCAGGQILVGDLDDDQRDDLLCWKTGLPQDSISIDLSSGVTRTNPQPFGTIDAGGWYSFCEAAGVSDTVTGRLADLSGDGRADFVCYDQRTGQVSVDLAMATPAIFDAATDKKVPNVPTPIWP